MAQVSGNREDNLHRVLTFHGKGTKSFLSSRTTERIECLFPNTSLLELKTPSWLAIHEYLGDHIFHFLLFHCLIFIAPRHTNEGSDPKNLIQLSGPPLSEYLQQGKRMRMPLRHYATPIQLLEQPAAQLDTTNITDTTRKKTKPNKRQRARLKALVPSEGSSETNQVAPKGELSLKAPTGGSNNANEMLPRFLLFYKNPRSIRKHIFSPSHELNQPRSAANAFR